MRQGRAGIFRGSRVIGLALVAAMLLQPVQAQPVAPPPAASHAAAAASEPPRLPPDATTHHTLMLPGRSLDFTAAAGAVRLTDDRGTAQAEVGFVAYQLEGADRAHRPVTFVFNGGPGMASAWLQVGAVGPWHIGLAGDDGFPSASPVPSPNPETWLDFTDLVFIDPPGTGYARILASGEEVRRRLWSVGGDVDAIAKAISLWLAHAQRTVSPKYLLGESYGGFRAPRLARQLASDYGVGVSGLVLLSPLLDLHRESNDYDPFGWVDRLPSEVAAARALHGAVTRADMADVEAYAAGDYLRDLLAGPQDAAATGRIVQRVAGFTGLDPDVVRRYGGRLGSDAFLRELDRAQARVGSVYDATILRPDPFPDQPRAPYPDPVLEGFKAPVTSAMLAIYGDRLHWTPDWVYRLENDSTFAQWDWGRGMGRPESVTALRNALALDPSLQVLIVHGLFDLRTPYFATALTLAMLPRIGPPDRLQLAVYPGGHMFYSREDSRAALHDAAKRMYGAAKGQ